MSLDGNAIVWVFDGYDGRAAVLVSMIAVMTQQLGSLLPTAGEDPFEQIVADLSDDPTPRMLDNPRLARMFPPALSNSEQADEFWRNSVAAQTRARLAAADTVVRACQESTGWVPVSAEDADDWVKTLSGLRLFWHTELAGPERLADTPDDGSQLRELVDWLGYLVEDLLETRAACLIEGRGLDL